ncbi:MAG TPA: 50S ribosomal protein L29 [Chloroflexi bacterium]|nr:MAG: 50S ribosomal protein L29 [Chloroflexota bacterium]HDD55753.1 50S ribosomal protein L29 [Chloroflexota bacterium]
MKAEEIRGLTEEKIRAEIDGAREELMNLRFQQSTGELLDTSRIREVRRSIARMRTILNEKAREGAVEGES